LTARSLWVLEVDHLRSLDRWAFLEIRDRWNRLRKTRLSVLSLRGEAAA